MSTLLITGGAGFIGSQLVRTALAQTERDIIVLDALTYAGHLHNLTDVLEDERLHFVRGDICDPSLLAELLASHDIDGVLHLAAESHVDRAIAGPEAFLKTNVEGTYHLLEACRRAWEHVGRVTGEGRQRRFVYVSTDEVFGALAPGESAFCEASPHRPNNPYAASKAAADHLARAWFRTYGLPVITSHGCNNYGPRQFSEKLIPLLILNAIEGRPLPLYGDGLHVRDWLHVADHCDALLALLERGEPGESYVIGSNDERTNLAVAQQICDEVDRQLGRPAGTSRALIEFVADRPGHDRRYAIDASKIKAELGWAPRRRMDDALPELVAWYIADCSG